MITAQEIYGLQITERRKTVLSQASIFEGDSQIEISEKVASILNLFIDEYFEILLEEDRGRGSESVLINTNLEREIDREIEIFKPLAIANLEKSMPTKENLIRKAKNPYELAGAVKLSFANRVTRNLSTTMGLLWERIANISPYGVNPELEFGIKIVGVDLIAKNINTGNIEYQQLKTQRNTLTGSQKGRSVAELLIHENPVFCACFSLSPWTFNHAAISRVSGSEFWERIGIDYLIFERKVKELILELEEIYISLM